MTKINPYVRLIDDYKHVIYTYDDADDSAGKDLFGNAQDLVLDLGCGAGNFCVKYATQNPDKNVVGFEIRYKRLVFSARKVIKHSLPNVRFVQSRIEHFDAWISPLSVAEVNSNFPDPWPKKKHRKHRYLNPALFKKIHACLKPGGVFIFKTDHQQYYDEIKGWLHHSDLFSVREQSGDYKQSAYFNPDMTTEFEMLFYRKNKPVHYLGAVKID